MAIVRKLKKITLDKNSHHTNVDCTYSIIINEDGQKCLQLDTYGSKSRKFPGKKSQSIRFAPEVIEQLKDILANEL